LEKPGFFTCLNGQLVAFETLCGVKKPYSSAKNLVSEPRYKKCPVVNCQQNESEDTNLGKEVVMNRTSRLTQNPMMSTRRNGEAKLLANR